MAPEATFRVTPEATFKSPLTPTALSIVSVPVVIVRSLRTTSPSAWAILEFASVAVMDPVITTDPSEMENPVTTAFRPVMDTELDPIETFVAVSFPMMSSYPVFASVLVTTAVPEVALISPPLRVSLAVPG